MLTSETNSSNYRKNFFLKINKLHEPVHKIDIYIMKICILQFHKFVVELLYRVENMGK